KLRRLLVDIDVEAGLTKHDGRREAADPGADDGDPDYRVSSVPPVLGKDALHIRDATARSHPPLGIEPVLIGGLLGLVYCDGPLQGGDQWLECQRVEQRAGRAGYP